MKTLDRPGPAPGPVQIQPGPAGGTGKAHIPAIQ